MLKLTLTVSLLGLAAVSARAASNPVSLGQQIGEMGTAAVLGIVAVVSVLGLVHLYRDKKTSDQNHVDRLYGLIESSTAATKEVAENLRQQQGVLVEVKDAVRDTVKIIRDQQ